MMSIRNKAEEIDIGAEKPCVDASAVALESCARRIESRFESFASIVLATCKRYFTEQSSRKIDGHERVSLPPSRWVRVSPSADRA